MPEAAAVEQDVFRRAWDELNAPPKHPKLREAAALFEDGRLGLAVRSLRAFLDSHPHDASALHLLARIALQQGHKDRAQALFQKCLEVKPGIAAARMDYANLLLEGNRPEAALAEADTLLKEDPRNPLFRRLKADALARANSDYMGSMELWRELIGDYPKRPECWVGYGNALRTLGLQDDCIAAFRTAIDLNPAFAAAWISLADFKTFRFSLSDIEQIERALTRHDLPTDDRTNLHFALGKAHADVNAFEKSFNCFAKANAIRRLAVKHDPDVLTAYVARCKQVFTSELFQKHAGSGSGRPDPIFLVGMPRAGSTLVEQILASHSQIEGTSELADLATLSRDIQTFATEQNQKFPDVISRVDADFLHRYGERYLAMTQIHRKSGRPFFTDKMGANFAHVGLIHLILPSAKIIDVRRHPMACCFSNFSQVFQDNAYRLTDMAHLYCDYVALMAHFDAVLPGKVHRVLYEELVSNPEVEIGRMLDYLGFGFEDACLKFFDTDRAVTTMSAQQVRRPIYRDALEYWRNYEPWLGSLKSALGPVYEMYPKVPAFG